MKNCSKIDIFLNLIEKRGRIRSDPIILEYFIKKAQKFDKVSQNAGICGHFFKTLWKV